VIYIIRTRATKEQLDEMIQTLATYIKLAVDIRRGILAGGGVLHADCESVLLEDGSKQEDVWGADWSPSSQQVTFESLINIRPRQNNPSVEILDPAIRQRVAEITHQLLGGL
jgi:RES domain-containing protein